MAAKYRKIDPRIWRDERFSRLCAEDKLIALYCLTAQSNRCGIFVFSPAMAAEELGTLPHTFRERFRNVCQTLRWGWDEGVRILYLPTWWKYNPPENANVFAGCLKDLEELPQSPLLYEFCNNVSYLPGTLGVTLRERWGERYPKPSPIQEQEQEQEQEQDSDSPEPAEPASVQVEIVPTEPPVLVFPVVGSQTAREWPLSREKLAEWQNTHPGIDCLAQAKLARQWLIDNPGRRKTFAGMTKFLGGWFGRAQDKCGAQAAPQTRGYPTAAEKEAERTKRNLLFALEGSRERDDEDGRGG